MGTRRVLVSVLVACMLVVAGLAAYFFVVLPRTPCLTLGGTKERESSTSSVVIGALTEYKLPDPSRWSNAIAVAPDGSVWFGEQSVPGVAHLFPENGTLVEYPWPTAARPTSKCGFESSIWGIALWNGMVWGTDADQDALVGLNPQTGASRVLNLTGKTEFPYTISVAADGSLWFTALAGTAVLGRVALNYTVSVLALNGMGKNIPTQVDFVNSTYAYVVALDPATNSGGLYSFDPEGVVGSITPQKVGGDYPLMSPNSVSFGAGAVWISQHGAASVAAFDPNSGAWTVFPTSTENYTITTLPYFVAVSGGRVWFNEHYGNKIAFIDPAAGTMTEYSESDPPVTNGVDIGNDLTIAPAPDGLWFTSTTGNYIGFASGSYTPTFSLSSESGNASLVQAGGQVTLRLTVNGTWRSALAVIVSDSESFSSVPKAISIVPSTPLISAGSGPVQLLVEVNSQSSLKPGQYTIAVTVSDGIDLRSVFFILDFK